MVTGAEQAQIMCGIIVTAAISIFLAHSFFLFITIFVNDCNTDNLPQHHRNVHSGEPHSYHKNDYLQFIRPCTSDTAFQQNALHQNTLRNSFRITTLNINHLIPKIDEIKILLSYPDSPHILCLSETFLSDSTPDEFISITNYSLHRRDRLNKSGGGLVIYVHDSVSATEILELQNNSIEGIWLRIQIQNMTKVIGLIYRPPSSVKQWTEEFTHVLEKTQ